MSNKPLLKVPDRGQLAYNIDHTLAAFPGVVKSRKVFYNADGTEALILVSQDLGVDYVISVDSSDGTASGTIEWSTGYTA